MLTVGGLAAVIYTDTLQAFVMIIGAVVLAVISMFMRLLKFVLKIVHCRGY